MKTIQIGNTLLGSGLPKVIVPIIDKTPERILETAVQAKDSACDIVEWRIDFYEDLTDFKTLISLTHQLKQILKEKPLLVTCRTYQEGGYQSISLSLYLSLYQALIAEGSLDLLDIELFLPEQDGNHLVQLAHEKGIRVILCNHEFDYTPEKDELLNRLTQMYQRKADICKIAVMPQTSKDVLTLLDATREMKERYPDSLLITMSMGTLGMITRVAGEPFGSIATFASLTDASAPGQLPVEKLQKILLSLYQG